MKNKILEKIRNSTLYAFFRKVRFYLHLIPGWHWFVGFVKHYFGGLYYRTDRNHLFLLSGGLAFSLFVCIIPMTLIIFWLLGKFLNSAEVEVQIITLIDTLIPYETYSAFVKEIIQQHDGRINFESELGKGSSFSFSRDLLGSAVSASVPVRGVIPVDFSLSLTDQIRFQGAFGSFGFGG